MRKPYRRLSAKLVLLIAFISIVPLSVYQKVQAQDPTFIKLTTDFGLSHNNVSSIVQDKKGFMWIGTSEGLNRYDGSSIITFYADENDSTQLATDQITAIEAEDDLLYVGTSRGFYIYNEKERVFSAILYKKNTLGHINRIVKVEDGSIYVCSSNGLYKFSKEKSSVSCVLNNVTVYNLLEYKRGVLWVSTTYNLILINDRGEIIKEYREFVSSSYQHISLTDNVACLFKDSSGNIWMGSNKNGLFRFDAEKELFISIPIQYKFNSIEVNIVRVIAEDDQHNLWIGTESGLFIYNPTSNVFRHYTQSFDESPGDLSDKAIYCIYKSREGIMWLGTYFGGVNYVLPRHKGFKVLKPDGGKSQLSGKAVSQIIQDNKGRYWIATEDGGVNIWDKRNNSISYLRCGIEKNNLSVNNVHALYEDKDHSLWIGTFMGGINKYDEHSGSIKVFKTLVDEPIGFTNNMVYAIQRDKNDDLWIGTTAGLNKFDPNKGRYELFNPEKFGGKFIYDFYKDHSENLWICLMDSDTLYHYDPATKKIKSYYYHDSSSIRTNGFICAFQDSKGRMWFGTIGRGLVQLEPYKNKFTTYTEKNGLPNNFIYGILEDSKSNLWISTNKGLSRFNPETKTYTNYDISHGLPNNQFNFKSAFKDREGWMYFGSINGLCYFHPDSLTVNTIVPITYLSDFKLFNKSIKLDRDSPFRNISDQTNAIILSYDDDVMTFEYGAISYHSSGGNKYAYYLEGYEKDWNYVGTKTSATYTSLAPGDYIFKVKSANNDGIWSTSPMEIKLTVLPPFWMTTWAKIFYVFLIVGLFLLYRQFLINRNKEKMAMQLQRMEQEKVNEVNQAKLNFFTYITHEFKTPLTLITASIDKFLMEKSTNKEERSEHETIRRNAKRLHILIEQLMEFRKVETDHARMNYVKGDIILFLKEIFFAFTPLFNKKNLDTYFSSHEGEFFTFFDADKLEKIVSNLLSNAVKYSVFNGLIEMDVILKIGKENEVSDWLELMISDSGVGMDPDELQNIFTAFYQTEQGMKSGDGTGIGLALVKSLVDFMKGTIQVESKQSTGTQIIVTLPLYKKVDQENIPELEGSRLINLDLVLPMERTEEEPAVTIEQDAPDYQVMIVEDSEELITFLGEHYNKKYRIVKAANGFIAWEKIQQSPPDIIITDIMMPQMDGIELCRTVKSDITTSHIPVVFLTAKMTIENRLAGLDEGADAYLSKPFSLKELDLVVQNQLAMRTKLRDHFLKFGTIRNMEVSVVNRDQEFILKLTQIVEKHLDNSEFNITKFAEEACVSRSLLHLKLKKLVNLSASDFIRNIRLQKAAEYLKSTDLNIMEIAYKVGYADPNYFSRAFKEKYRVNPTEYRQDSDLDQ